MRGKIRIVCFDAGGVLVRICRSWEEGCARAGIAARALALPPGAEARRARLHDDYQRGRMECGEYCRKFASLTDGVFSEREIRAVHDAWILGEYSGARTIVERLNGVPGLATALLSNTDESHWKHPAMMGSDSSAVSRVRHPHASHLLGYAKPDPAIYRAFELACGASAGEVLFFDDREDNILAARGSGWHAVRIDPDGDTASQVERAARELALL